VAHSLYMIQLSVNLEALLRFLTYQGLNTPLDEDLGYGVHAWLKALFRDLAPKPFRLFPATRGRGPAKLLAYAPVDGDSLSEHAFMFAEPSARAVCSLDTDLFSAPMPAPEAWRSGRRLGFEVLVCPVARRSRDGTERDFFLHRADSTGPQAGLRREEVYADWLATHLWPAANLNEVRLTQFRLVRQLRQGARSSDVRQRARLVRPQALLKGQLTIADSDGFAGLLARGVGRHRSFGYGMLLLRPL